MLRAVMEINTDQRKRAVTKVREILGGFRGKMIGVWELSFKPNTDDLRDAPSVSVIRMLQNKETEVHAYDPVSTENAKQVLRERPAVCLEIENAIRRESGLQEVAGPTVEEAAAEE